MGYNHSLPMEFIYGTVEELEESISNLDDSWVKLPTNDLSNFSKGYVVFSDPKDAGEYHYAPRFEDGLLLRCIEIVHQNFDEFFNAIEPYLESSRLFDANDPRRMMIGVAIHPIRELHLCEYSELRYIENIRKWEEISRNFLV